MTELSALGTGQHWRWYWRGTASLAVLGFISGVVGTWSYERAADPAGAVDAGSVLYHTLQLFILHAPHLDRPIPWPLHAGRLLGALVFAAVSGKAIWTIFRDEWLLAILRLPWTRGHVIVCGLGEVGLRVAVSARQRRLRVVAIEKDPHPGRHDLARRLGILVIEGDARYPGRLEAAQVDRASSVVASCHDDQTNVAIMKRVADMVSLGGSRETPLICRALIQDSRTRELLAAHAIFPPAGKQYQLNFADLDRHIVAARQALERHPLDFEPIRKDDATRVRLVVIGFDRAGECLALHAAQMGHFANEVDQGHPLQLVVVDSAADSALRAFKARYPCLACDPLKTDWVCETESRNLDPDAAESVRQLADYCLKAPYPVLVTYAFCREDERGDDVNFRLALELAKQIEGRPAQILVRQDSRSGFASLLPTGSAGSPLLARTYPFGMLEDVFDWDVLVHDSEDKVARALHEVYRQGLLKASPPQLTPEWDELPEEFRESNRQAADHIPIKLRALGYHREALTDRKERVLRFQEAEIDLLAKMEHARWFAERCLAGWTYGPETTRSRKISRALVEWDKLPPEDQRKDPEQINAIVDALISIKVGIYR